MFHILYVLISNFSYNTFLAKFIVRLVLGFKTQIWPIIGGRTGGLQLDNGLYSFGSCKLCKSCKDEISAK